MSELAVLKKSLGEAGAFIDESNGRPSRLLEVLTALVNGLAESLSLSEVNPSTGVKEVLVVDQDTSYEATMRVKVGTTGSSSSTTVELQVNGSVLITLDIDNTDPDGTIKFDTALIDLKQDDVVELEVTSVAGAAMNLSVGARLRPVIVE